MKIKLVADSSANIHTNPSMEVAYVPLKIVTDQKEYTDTETLDVPGMLKDLKEYKGKSGTACPSISDWIDAFGDADEVYGVAITSNLSGCYNAGSIAAEEYMNSHPGARVFLLDTLSTGPEMQLILEKFAELINAGKSFDEICEEIRAYHARTHLLFSLESLDNFAKNGRVNPIVAKAVGVLGIRIVGKASDEGTLQQLHKCRGEKRALQQLLDCMIEMGYNGGKVRISHSYNEDGAATFADMLRTKFPMCDISIVCNRGLCCYYAEEGGILVGFEG